MQLILSRPQSYWPPPAGKIEPHPLMLTHVEHQLIQALYNFDVVASGRADDLVPYHEMSPEARREYGAEVRRRLAQRQ